MDARHNQSAAPRDAAPDERSRIVRLCARFTGDAEAAEDLAQETLIEAWRHAAQLRDEAARRSWLSGIARNVCLRWARRRGQEGSRIVRFGAVEALPGGNDPAGDWERAELALLLDGALGLLSPEDRRVLVLRYVEGLSHAAIGARLGVSAGAVAVRVHRARLALRRALAQRRDGEASATDLARAALVHPPGWAAASRARLLDLPRRASACWRYACGMLTMPYPQPRVLARPAVVRRTPVPIPVPRTKYARSVRVCP